MPDTVAVVDKSTAEPEGLAPEPFRQALTDWATHLANHPERQMALAQQAFSDAVALWRQSMGMATETVQPASDDRRYRYAGWQMAPFAMIQQSFLRAERWWRGATTGIPGVSPQHQRMVSFLAQSMLDAASPSNNPALNPEVIDAALASRGESIEHGIHNAMTDIRAVVSHAPQTLAYRPGQDVAITPGAVVFRNEIVELIQYTPTTEHVRPEPILIVPAWIMKYYILDLEPAHSLIRYLVAQGFTVFCISWINPGAAQRELAFDDYRTQGAMAALQAVTAICGGAKIHALGYCLGGTLLSITAAAMARDGDDRLASLMLLAAQTDFSEPGELGIFMTEAQLTALDASMAKQGFLDGAQMAGAFALVRSNDLIWSNLTRRYYLGQDSDASDMVSWDADSTRMPYRMHSEYLRKLYLYNDLAGGRFDVGGSPVSVGAIHVPCFVVSAETDWVAPWRSVYKFLHLTHGDVRFVLASGGHNGGIVSVPGSPHRHYRILERAQDQAVRPAEEWVGSATPLEGSWWPAASAFLALHSSPETLPPSLGNEDAGYGELEAAPGHYVLQR